jgi:hypothetical protein
VGKLRADTGPQLPQGFTVEVGGCWTIDRGDVRLNNFAPLRLMSYFLRPDL